MARAGSEPVVVRAHGKVNLALAVLGRRPDGYHRLDGVMQSIGLFNRLTLQTDPGVGVRLLCDDPDLPTDRRNTAVRAAQLFLAAVAPGDGLRITLQKGIPYQAGLGSASADAAGVLAGLNRLYGGPLSAGQLLELGAQVGADVPFCLRGGICRAEGIGERLTALPPLPPSALLVAKPPEGASTPEIFARFDASAQRPDPFEPDAFLAALREGKLESVARFCGNALEGCCPVLRVAQLKRALVAQGALYAGMSGSGSAVFGIFAGKEAVASAQASMEREFGDCRFYRTEPVGEGVSFPGEAPADPPSI